LLGSRSLQGHHGWCALDSDQYNKDEAERAHARFLALFKKALA